MSKNSRMSELLAITSRLIACMEHEVDLLRSLKPQELRQLQSDKMALADAYRAFTLALREPLAEGETVDAGLCADLVEATEHFQAAVQNNLRALRAMRDVNERVMRAIVHALDERAHEGEMPPMQAPRRGGRSHGRGATPRMRQNFHQGRGGAVGIGAGSDCSSDSRWWRRASASSR